MSKWPKAWIEVFAAYFNRPFAALRYDFQRKDSLAENILADLAYVGALKELPKSREWWVCPDCYTVYDSIHLLNRHYLSDRGSTPYCQGEPIKVREVEATDENS